MCGSESVEGKGDELIQPWHGKLCSVEICRILGEGSCLACGSNILPTFRNNCVLIFQDAILLLKTGSWFLNCMLVSSWLLIKLKARERIGKTSSSSIVSLLWSLLNNFMQWILACHLRRGAFFQAGRNASSVLAGTCGCYLKTETVGFPHNFYFFIYEDLIN